MVVEQLVDYIRTYRVHGYSDQQLYAALLQQGYHPEVVRQAFMQAVPQSNLPVRKIVGIAFFSIIILVIAGGLFLAFKGFDKPVCGNGIKEEGETSTNCCEDAGCYGGALCRAGVCVVPEENEPPEEEVEPVVKNDSIEDEPGPGPINDTVEPQTNGSESPAQLNISPTMNTTVVNITEANSTEETNSTPLEILPVVLTKRFIKDATGTPSVVRISAKISANSAVSCRLAHESTLYGQGQSFSGGETSYFTLVNPVNGKLDLSKWRVCCDNVMLDDFTTVKQTTGCST